MEIEESCEASELEKHTAATAINNILSVLARCSESTGRMVCGKRCSLPAAGLINSSLNISLGRIKQSFVLWVVANSLYICEWEMSKWRLLISLLVFLRRIDPHLPNMPVVYASDAFLKLTGSQILRDPYLGHARVCTPFFKDKNMDNTGHAGTYVASFLL